MAGLGNLNLIHLLDFYLMLAFLVSTYLRFRQYQVIVGLAVAVPGRWPRLLQLVRQHRMIFLTWSTVLPGALALSLCLLNTLACRLVWPHANLTVKQLDGLWLALPVIALLGATMLAVDVYAT